MKRNPIKFLLISASLTVGCGINDVETISERTLSDEEVLAEHVSYMNLSADDDDNLIGPGDFYEQPLSCDGFHSQDYYCDGYVPLNSSELDGLRSITPNNYSTSYPKPYFNGMQIIGPFDKSRPSLILIHDWNNVGPGVTLGMPNKWAIQAQQAGYNTLFFHWNELAYDDGRGCPVVNKLGGFATPCNAAHKLFKKGQASDVFMSAYHVLFRGKTAPVRLVGHSLGTNLAIYSSYRMYKNPSFNDITKPTRLDLIDPYVSPDMGQYDLDPYYGQIPPASELPSYYRNNIVRNFVKGSSCHSNWVNSKAPNYTSQYCQMEGMMYQLLAKNNVPSFVLSSVGAKTFAKNFSKVSYFQSFASSAFKGVFKAKHNIPLASYMFSIAKGEPSLGCDASTFDNVIYNRAVQRVMKGQHNRLIQSRGFDTISFMDDEFQVDYSDLDDDFFENNNRQSSDFDDEIFENSNRQNGDNDDIFENNNRQNNDFDDDFENNNRQNGDNDDFENNNRQNDDNDEDGFDDND